MIRYENKNQKAKDLTNKDVIDYLSLQGITALRVTVVNNEVIELEVSENNKDTEIFIKYPELTKV